MLHLSALNNTGGKAADTGSAVHRAVEAWHRNGQNYEGALDVMAASKGDYPLADLNDARLHFRPYTEDPRNINAEIVAIEQKVQFTITPSVDDPTQAPIVIQGTLDQIRRVGGALSLYDVKTGERIDGWTMMHAYALQIAGYCIGATGLFGEPVHPGAIIRTRGYRVRGVKAHTEPAGVFFEYAWGLPQCELLMDAVRNVVSAVRSGRVWPGPGDHCSYCPAKGLDNCLPRLHELRLTVS
jgi:hypothetical protein